MLPAFVELAEWWRFRERYGVRLITVQPERGAASRRNGMYGPLQRVVIELKILRGALEETLATGLEQTAGYTRQVRADEAHLVLFDRDPDTPWDEKIWQRSESFDGLDIRVWGA